MIWLLAIWVLTSQFWARTQKSSQHYITNRSGLISVQLLSGCLLQGGHKHTNKVFNVSIQYIAVWPGIRLEDAVVTFVYLDSSTADIRTGLVRPANSPEYNPKAYMSAHLSWLPAFIQHLIRRIFYIIWCAHTFRTKIGLSFSCSLPIRGWVCGNQSHPSNVCLTWGSPGATLIILIQYFLNLVNSLWMIVFLPVRLQYFCCRSLWL